MKVMIKANTPGSATWFITPEQNAENFTKLLEQYSVTHQTFRVGKIPLEELPAEIQDKVKDILKAFHNVSVIYEYGEFRTSTGTCIRSKYNWDHFVCGRYSDTEIYTEEERRKNYMECCG